MVRSLPYAAAESNVFRVAVFSIVLAITGNPITGALLCRTWCNPNAAAASGCHHELATFAIVAGEDGCRNAVLNGTAFVQEDVRRGVPSPHARHAIPVSGYEVSGWTSDADIGHAPGRSPSLEKRPLETALRI